MDGLRGNKIFAAILVALILGLVSSMIGDALVSPTYLSETVYKVEVLESSLSPTEKSPKADILTTIGTLLATASVEGGKKVAKKCVQCHTFEQGGPNRIGPNLWDVVGKKQASKPGFSYSSAAKAMHADWTYNDLNEFLFNPRKYLSGTKMSFAGLKSDNDRANIILYLRSLSPSPVPLPPKK